MSIVKIKICGITNLKDALICVEAGVDMLGFIFYAPSPRSIDSRTAALIIKDLPENIAAVGVFVNEDEQVVRNIADETGIKVLQFHGQEEPGYCDSFAAKYRLIKVLFPQKEDVVEKMQQYSVDHYMLEGAADFASIKEIVESNNNCFISGDLTLDNLENTLSIVKPYAIDLARGTEASPGIKDPAKVKKIMEIIDNHG